MAEPGNIYEEWLDSMNKTIKHLDKIPSENKRCPKCKKLTLVFDVDRGLIRCENCGFEQFLRK